MMWGDEAIRAKAALCTPSSIGVTVVTHTFGQTSPYRPQLRSLLSPVHTLHTNTHSEPDSVFNPLNLDPSILADLQSVIARRLTPKPVKIRADVEVKCFAYQGIESIRKALKAGEALSTEEIPIKIRLVAPPLYVISTTSTDKTAALGLMERCVDVIGETVKEEGGDMVVKMNVSCAFTVFFAEGTMEERIRGGWDPQGAHVRRAGCRTCHPYRAPSLNAVVAPLRQSLGGRRDPG